MKFTPEIFVGLALSVLAVLIIGDGARRSRIIRKQMEQDWEAVPIDKSSGLLTERVCIPRLDAELHRARRNGGSVFAVMVVVVSGDADQFARNLKDTLRIPELGFRLSPTVFCCLRPSGRRGDSVRNDHADLLGRIGTAAHRESLSMAHLVAHDANTNGHELLQQLAAEQVHIGGDA